MAGPIPQKAEKPTCGGAVSLSAGTLPRRNQSYANHLEWWGDDIGWATSPQVCRWFEEQYEKYAAENPLKIKAHNTFGRFNDRVFGLDSPMI